MRESAQRPDRHVEDVACAALGLDVLWTQRIRLDLAPQPQNLDVDRPVEDFCGIEPRKLEQLLAGEDPQGCGAERLQQAKFPVGELDAVARRRTETARAQVQLPAAELVSAALPVARGQQLRHELVAAKHRANACEQLARAERL